MSGYALLKRPLGGPWNASKEIQRTGRRFHQIDKSSYGPPHIGQVGQRSPSPSTFKKVLQKRAKDMGQEKSKQNFD